MASREKNTPGAPARGARDGRWGERRAARHLAAKGLRVIGRNLRIAGGELDVVALDGRTLVVVEVKTSSVDTPSDPLERMSAEKIRVLNRAALALVKSQRQLELDGWRGDVIVVEFERGILGWRRCRRVEWLVDYFAIG